MKNEKLKKALLEIADNCADLADIMKDAISYTDANNANDFLNELDERIDEQEIIYYARALEYLGDNDASLRKSLELADELGFTPKQLNSELLATILYQQNLRDELNDIRSDIESAFDENQDDDENNND